MRPLPAIRRPSMAPNRKGVLESGISVAAVEEWRSSVGNAFRQCGRHGFPIEVTVFSRFLPGPSFALDSGDTAHILRGRGLTMRAADYVIDLILSVVLIVGAYQFYFWCQRNPLGAPREFQFTLDDRIPYLPGWVWVYSFLYYPVILYVNLLVDSPKAFTHLAMSYLLLLALQMVFFLTFPVVTPTTWRIVNREQTSAERFLAFVRRFDARSNSFPSMHTSVATLTALHLSTTVGPWAYAFTLLIGLSCLFTKQHYLIDVPAGAVLGLAAFHVYRLAV